MSDEDLLSWLKSLVDDHSVRAPFADALAEKVRENATLRASLAEARESVEIMEHSILIALGGIRNVRAAFHLEKSAHSTALNQLLVRAECALLALLGSGPSPQATPKCCPEHAIGEPLSHDCCKPQATAGKECDKCDGIGAYENAWGDRIDCPHDDKPDGRGEV